MFQGMGHIIFRFTRAGGVETNPATFNQRAATFASAIANTGHVTLLTRREASGLDGYLIIPADSEKNNAPLRLAHTVGARADLTELPDDLGDTPAIEHSPALRETQSGIDPTELPRLLGHTLPEGSWVAVTMRKPPTLSASTTPPGCPTASAPLSRRTIPSRHGRQHHRGRRIPG